MRLLKNTGIIWALTLCCWSNSAFSQETPVIRFGIIADIQYGDCETKGSRFYRNSLEKLEECVADLNRQQVEFTINLGDLVDRNPADMDAVLDRQRLLKAKVHNTTGNHDYVGITDNKKLFKQLDMPDEYYSFKKGNWHFIILNTNEIASYSNVAGTWKEKELAAMRDQIRLRNRSNGQDWNGGISSKQLKWLTKLLRNSQKKNENVLVFSHHPVYPAEGFTALNDQEILTALAAFSCVKAVFSGHHHVGAFGDYQGIPCITTEGMIETEKENAYATVELYRDKIVVAGKGRTKSYEIAVGGR